MSLLEQHFDVAFAAPDGIKKLRELILTLAMQGKLVPQDPNDEPASELLRSIEVEKKRLVKEGKIKQAKHLPEIEPEEVPYVLPDGWKWVRLGSISTKLTDGSHNPPKDSGIGYPMLSSQNVNFGKIDFSNPSRYVSESDFHSENKRTKIFPNDILLTIVASLGRPAVVPENAPKFVLQRSVAVISTPISSDFLCRHLGSPLCINYYLEHGKGTAQKGIYLGQLNNMPIALPPFAEQRRIVAKIDQLMARCDELEKLRVDRSQRLLTVHTAALDRLLTAKDSSEFSTAWSFITQHFGELYSVKENVVELRKTILQLAVMGKLVRQDPNDEPASELLRSIELEKQRLVKEGKIKAQNSLPKIKPEEMPYALPKGWEWCRWNDVALKIGDIDHKMPMEVDNGVPYVSPRDFFGENEINFKQAKKISVQDFEKLRLKIQPEKFDIIFPRYGTLGVNRFVLVDTDFLASYSCAIIKNLKEFINPKYSYYYSISKLVRKEIERYTKKTTQANVGVKSIQVFLYPLPPLAEQRRIVEKIDRLMGMCDRLEESIESAKGKQTYLLNALMSQV